MTYSYRLDKLYVEVNNPKAGVHKPCRYARDSNTCIHVRLTKYCVEDIVAYQPLSRLICPYLSVLSCTQYCTVSVNGYLMP